MKFIPEKHTFRNCGVPSHMQRQGSQPPPLGTGALPGSTGGGNALEYRALPPQSSAEVKTEWRYTSTVPCAFMARYRENYNWINQLSNTTIWWLAMLFITKVSTTCFGSYGHLQIDRLTTKLVSSCTLACQSIAAYKPCTFHM